MMKLILCIMLSQSLSMLAYGRALQGAGEWKVATFRGLTMGRSTRTDMLRVLGKPDRIEQFKEERKTGMLYMYKTEEEIPGQLIVTVNDPGDVIFSVELNPRRLTKEEALKKFGDAYQITRYDFDLCLGDGESAPIYESPTGNLTFIEYRSRGIAILANEQGKVDEIKYVSEPLGSKTSRCKRSTVAFDIEV